MRRRLASALTFAAVAVTIVALALAAIAVTTVARRPLPESEANQLIALLSLPKQATIAEIGAGNGALTVAVAKRVGGNVTVYSTELGRRQLIKIWIAVTVARTWNVKVVQGSESETKLPADSCDAVFMRRVYHHFMKPAEMDASLFNTIRSGGLLAVIDQEPTPYKYPDVLPSRGGDGVRPAMLVKELSEAGFHHVRTINRWDGELYIALFQKP
jgi:predicted methyltransferase